MQPAGEIRGASLVSTTSIWYLDKLHTIYISYIIQAAAQSRIPDTLAMAPTVFLYRSLEINEPYAIL